MSALVTAFGMTETGQQEAAPGDRRRRPAPLPNLKEKPVMTGTSPDGDPAVTACIGPWTVHVCVTASCTRCGAVPLDEDTALTPHFASPQQARGELTRDWGWHLATARAGWADDDELLCPPCAAAADCDGKPRLPAPDPDGGQEPGAVSWWEALEGRVGGLRREPPANARVPRPPQPRGKKAEPGAEADGRVPD
jgi:hypothetical protein